MQLILERERGCIVAIDSPTPTVEDSDDDLDDVVVKTHSRERDKANAEFGIFCNICKRKKHRPKTYKGETLRFGTATNWIEMGKVATRGDDIRASPPFVTCNLADFIDDVGSFDLVKFFEFEKDCFPTLYKLAVCLGSVRTNEVGSHQRGRLRALLQHGWVCFLPSQNTLERAKL